MRTSASLAFTLRWAVLALFYLALAGQASLGETLAAVTAGFMTALWLVAIRRHGRAYAPALMCLLRLLPAWLGSMGRDLWKMTGVLLGLLNPARHAEGRFVAQAFDPGHPGPHARSRRALIVMRLSLSPNSVAVAVRHERQQLVRHELVASEHKDDPQWPT